MLSVFLALACSIAVPPDEKTPKVVVVPFGEDVASHALSEAAENALPVAARERGLSSTRAELVKPVVEAMRGCREDGCRIAAARRLGARYAVLGAVDGGALLLRIIDVDVGDAAGSARVDGDPPAVLAGVPGAVDSLVEQVAPRSTRLLARARHARDDGDLDAADRAYGDAIAAARDDAARVDLWLERCRLFDAADRAKESAIWDAFAAALGPGAPGFGTLDDVDRARVRDAVRANLLARADFEARMAEGDKAERLTAAARIHEKIAALFPEDAAAQTVVAASLLAQAGDTARAHTLLEKVAGDEHADADVRVRALARMHRIGR